ncbi:MAG: TonB-dependent receptor [Henriciella sp.]|jgi:outer membrane receptor protein involved in Fe transport|nr:TonB-dependent receptor [Henriciella sp.]
MAKSKLRRHLVRTTVIAGLAAPLLSHVAIAQEGDDTESVQETITVTGSRIQNSNLTSSSPITNVNAADLTLSNTVNAEQFLNQLPQVIPGFDSTSNNPGIGEATVDLRGLGANRTLVLVNGRRYVTSNQNPGAVDLNTIPAALVERVDILTGGASAVYGSDAVAGVVNFIMKDDFEGLEVSAGYESTEEGDGAIYTAAATMGGNFDSGRGNAVLSIEYTQRESVLQGDRAGSFFTLADNGVAAGLQETGSVNIPSTFALDFDVDYTSILGINAPCGVEGTVDDGTGVCTTDSFGFIFNPSGPGILPFINAGPNTNRYNYAPENYLQIPQERYSMYTNVSYDITENLEAYAQAVFVTSQTEQLLAPTPIFGAITVNLDNPFLAGDTEALAALNAISLGNGGGTLADADGNGVPDATFSAGRRFQETGGRLSDIRNDSFQVNGGLRGSLTDTWTWEAFASFGQAETAVSQTGNISFSAYTAAVANGTANIFQENGLTQDVVDAISVTGIITGQTEQFVASASASGDLFGLTSPAAENPIMVAFGGEYREENLSTRGAGLGPDVRGFNQAPDIFGDFDVKELFVEINAPLVENAPMAEEITFTGAYRVSDYSTEGVGQVSSYAAGLSWTPIPELRLRGQFQQAVRAPNIGELFSPQTNGFPNIADPCSGGTLGGFDPANAAVITANCESNPAALANVPTGATGTPIQVNAQIEGLFGGNPTLQEETAETLTLGAIWEPSFIDNLAVTVDYFDIQIEDVVAGVPSQRIFDFCYIDGLPEFCNAIRRNPDGTVLNFDSFSRNAAELSTKGIDISVDYSFDTDSYGTFGVYSLVTYTDESNFIPLPGEDPIEAVGFYGATVGEPTPEWSFNTRFDWALGDYGARLRWTRISSVEDDLFANGGTPDLFITGVDAYDQFDLTGFWDVTDNVSLTVGVENLLDEDFVIIGDDSAEQSNTYPATYDTLGRTWFARVTASF